VEAGRRQPWWRCGGGGSCGCSPPRRRSSTSFRGTTRRCSRRSWCILGPASSASPPVPAPSPPGSMSAGGGKLYTLVMGCPTGCSRPPASARRRCQLVGELPLYPTWTTSPTPAVCCSVRGEGMQARCMTKWQRSQSLIPYGCFQINLESIVLILYLLLFCLIVIKRKLLRHPNT
jgi:hypothetical protein